MIDYAKMRYNLLGNAGHWFPGMNYAALQGRDLTGALKESPFKHQIEGWLSSMHDLLHESAQETFERILRFTSIREFARQAFWGRPDFYLAQCRFWINWRQLPSRSWAETKHQGTEKQDVASTQ